MVLQKFLYKLWGYSKVEKSNDRLLLEIDFSYTESILRQGIFLFLFGSSLVALFLGGLSAYLFYYGATVFTFILIFFIILPAIVFPENYLAGWLGYDVNSTVDTSQPNRYKVTYSITKKPKGLFQTELHATGINIKGDNFGFDVNPAGFIKEKDSNTGTFLPLKYLFWITNFIVSTRAFFIFLISIATFVFSFFPIVNIAVIFVLGYSLFHYIVVRWKNDTRLNKIFILGSCLVLIADIISAIIVYSVIFIKF